MPTEKAKGKGKEKPEGYIVEKKIPCPATWFLILDGYGKQNDRDIHVSLEVIPFQNN